MSCSNNSIYSDAAQSDWCCLASAQIRLVLSCKVSITQTGSAHCKCLEPKMSLLVSRAGANLFLMPFISMTLMGRGQHHGSKVSFLAFETYSGQMNSRRPLLFSRTNLVFGAIFAHDFHGLCSRSWVENLGFGLYYLDFSSRKLKTAPLGLQDQLCLLVPFIP